MPPRPGRRLTGLLWLALLVSGACAAASPTACSDDIVAKIPPRAADAREARDILSIAGRLEPDEREALFVSELLAGNLPPALRRAQPIAMRSADTTVVLCVLPDYLAIGSDVDAVMTPLRLASAANIADRYGFVLPTPAIVDAIYAQARVHLQPQPMPAGPQMTTLGYYARHNAMVHEQREGLHALLGQLTAGHKKDLVITNRLWSQPDRVAIYGWHRPDGRPIQPLSTVHGDRYADYSHGVRLVSDTAYVDGRSMRLTEMLADPTLARALSGEGPIRRLAALLQRLEARR